MIDDFSLPEIKTKALAGILSTLQVPKSSVIVDAGNENLRMSARNLDTTSSFRRRASTCTTSSATST